MGCICSKGISADEYIDKESKKSSKRFIASSRRDEVVVEVDNGANDATTRLISDANEENVGSRETSWDEEEKNKVMVYDKPEGVITQRPEAIESRVNGGHPEAIESRVNGGQPEISRLFSIRNGVDGSQASAGWPPWLTAVAGEAIKGWLPRRAESFEKLDKIGQGTYSSVYRARDLETGKIVALKKVRFVNMDPESVRFMAREILVLRRLDHPNVMKLEGLVTSRVSGNIYLVFEYMEHDLAGLAASPTIKFTEPQIKYYMQQLLRGLEHCHSRGVLHRDIKGSNLLIDDNGNLKIGDFGLATFFCNPPKQPLTSRVVTLWYRPPELLLGATDYGVAVDLWSAGCILAELLAGKPIMPGRTEVEQLHKIFKLCGSPSEEYWKNSKLPHATVFKPQQPYKRVLADTFKDVPASALSLLDSLLAVEPDHRGSASSALQNEFFTTQPLPCDPSTLPKYPPSKEFDAKQRDDEARRQRAAGGKGRGVDSNKKGTRESKAVPAPYANAELQASIQKRQGQRNPQMNSENFNHEEDDGGSGFPIEPYLKNGGAFGVVENQRYNKSQGAQLSMFSNSVAVGSGSSRLDLSRDESAAHPQWLNGRQNGRYNHLNNAAESSHHLMNNRPNSTYKKHGQPLGKDSAMGYAPKKNRIHYSGPLLPPGGNIDEMLKEHEKQIQRAVRKAHLDRAKTKRSNTDNRLTESLLHYGGEFR